MVSFDIASLFTKDPIHLALKHSWATSTIQSGTQSTYEFVNYWEKSRTWIIVSSVNLLFVENTTNKILEQWLVLPFHQ